MVNAAGAPSLSMPDLKKVLKTRAQLAEQNMPKARPVFSSLLEKPGNNSVKIIPVEDRVTVDNPGTVELLAEIADSSPRAVRDRFKKVKDKDVEDLKDKTRNSKFDERKMSNRQSRFRENVTKGYDRESDRDRKRHTVNDNVSYAENEFTEQTITFDSDAKVPRHLRKKGLRFSAYDSENVKLLREDIDDAMFDAADVFDSVVKSDDHTYREIDTFVEDNDEVNDVDGLTYSLDDINLVSNDDVGDKKYHNRRRKPKLSG